MNAVDILDISREGIIVLLKMGGPILAVALVTGLTISLLQAMTQVQEMTLTFVPKMIVTFAALILLLPFMGQVLQAYTQELFHRIVGLS